MTQPVRYPLEQLMRIKKNRFDQAVKLLEEKKRLLEKEYEKLWECTKERDEVSNHRLAKLAQLRSLMDEGDKVDKILQLRGYLKVVDEKLAEKEKKVVAQQKNVDTAQKQVDQATTELFQKKKDLEKLEIHREEWKKEAQYLIDRQEASEQDEQGSATHTVRKKEIKRKHK